MNFKLFKKPVYMYGDNADKKKTADTTDISPPDSVQQPFDVEGLEDDKAYSNPAIQESGDEKKKRQKKQKTPKVKKERSAGYATRITARGIIGISSIALALVIAFVLSPFVTRMANEEMGEVLRIPYGIESIPKGTLLEASHFEVVSIPLKAAPKNAVQKLESVIGRYAATDLTGGDYVLSSKLCNELPFKDAYLYTLPREKQVISVRIKSFENGLAGKLMAGDLVSVYASVLGEKDDGYLSLAPPELRYVLVLAVTSGSGADYDKNNIDVVKKEEFELPVTVELMVGERQARALAGLNQKSVIHLSFVSRGNPEFESDMLALQEQLLLSMEAEEYGAEDIQPVREDDRIE